eukprot:m.108732 g.108732  ORF g.108732 m.108732 type:complete len:51 (+) comp22646_c0_seq3:1085-1237(+)
MTVLISKHRVKHERILLGTCKGLKGDEKKKRSYMERKKYAAKFGTTNLYH